MVVISYKSLELIGPWAVCSVDDLEDPAYGDAQAGVPEPRLSREIVMPSQEENGLPGHFAEIEAEYSVLLSLLCRDEYNSTITALKPPLTKLFYNSYLERHARQELAEVDLVEFLGGFFLFDSQGCYSPEAASRVVGAIGVSQETGTLKELLSHLRVKHREGQSTERTLELVRALLWNAEDTASPKKKQALYRAISAALGIERRSLMQVFENIASKSSYRSRLSYKGAAYLRELSSFISASLQEEAVPVSIPRPCKGHLLPEGFWENLRELVQIADRRLSESKKASLIEALSGFYSSGYKELLDNLRSPTDEQIDLAEKYVCAVVDSSKGRPRNTLAQRRMRFKNSTKYQYDVGHFLPHSAGGPPDINFFIQERGLNRGWSEQGKRYRWLENMVFSHPGTFYFVRPVYGDLSPVPINLEWGALLDETLLRELADDIERMPDLHLIRPPTSEPKLAWLISVFENFKVDAIREMRISTGWTDGL